MTKPEPQPPTTPVGDGQWRPFEGVQSFTDFINPKPKPKPKP